MQSAKQPQTTSGAAKRRSGQLDFSGLGPLKAGGTVGFTAFRDQDTEAVRRKKARKKSNGNIADDSDDEDDDDENEIIGKMEDIDDQNGDGKSAPEDANFGGELADGVNRIRVRTKSNASNAPSWLTSPCSLSAPTRPTRIATPPQRLRKGERQRNRLPRREYRHASPRVTRAVRTVW